MPPEKRAKTGKARGGRRTDRPKGGASAPKKRSPTPLFALWVLAVISLVSLIYFAEQSQRLPELPVDPATESSKARNATADISPEPYRVSIIIDDLGPDIGIAKKFASLPFPVTLSVLPHQAHSREIAEMAHLAGKEVILHLPMEPVDKKENPGRGALLISMSGDEIRRNIKAALDTSPFFDGVNNHMGSRITPDAQIMKVLMSELKEKDLFFIDSMTTSESIGWKIAQEMNIPTLKRDIFLDDSPSEDDIRAQIAKLVKIAKVQGMALAIGHPRMPTLRSLQEAAGHFREEGIEIVATRDLMKK